MLSSSCFEALPDEIILHICQYLRGADVLFSFYNLNRRLNITTTGYCRYVNLMSVSYEQFSYAVTHVLPKIGSLVQTFILNANWESIIHKNLRSILFHSHLSLLFPRLQRLTVKWFTTDKLLSFVRTIENFPLLIELDIRFLKGNTIDSLLENVLSANNGRLSIVSFDYDSVDLDISGDIKSTFYPNIQELSINLTLRKFIPQLFLLVPNVCRLYLSVEELSNDSKWKSLITDLPLLIHLTIFQLRTINLFWAFDEITHILKAMPFLQELTLDIRTEDKSLVDKENLLTFLPKSILKLNYFIRYYVSKSDGEIDQPISFSSPHSSVVSMLDKTRHRFIVYTIPCQLYSTILPATISQQMPSGWKYMQQTKDLHISDIKSVIDIFLILQHFRRLRILTLDAKDKTETLTLPSTLPSTNLKLPCLKQIEICGIFELFPLLNAAPNIDYMIIYFDCLKILLDNESTRYLLNKQIVRLNITDWIDIESDVLEHISRVFNSLRHLVITLKNTQLSIDDFILKILSLWKNKSRLSIDVKGLLSKEISQNLRQWVINHSHLKVEDPFTVECDNNWFDLWF